MIISINFGHFSHLPSPSRLISAKQMPAKAERRPLADFKSNIASVGKLFLCRQLGLVWFGAYCMPSGYPAPRHQIAAGFEIRAKLKQHPIAYIGAIYCLQRCRDMTEEAKREKREEWLPEGLSLVRKGVASPLVTMSVGEKS